MEHAQQAYRKTLDVSCRVAWSIPDVLPDDARLDLQRPFLPESLAGAAALDVLAVDERRTLNQIRGHSYLALFGLVEEFILPYVLDHVRARLGADDWEVRALLQFASEEAKHIQLFRCFADRFARDFGHRCDVIGPAASIAEAVLSHHPLGVALAILHIEWMTQRHYVDAVRSDEAIDPLFRSLLRHHWIEESQHARLDTLMVQGIAATLGTPEIRRGLEDYQRICALLHDGLLQQVDLDLDALQRAIGRDLDATTRGVVRDAQRRAYHYTFIESGATHSRFLATYGALARR